MGCCDVKGQGQIANSFPDPERSPCPSHIYSACIHLVRQRERSVRNAGREVVAQGQNHFSPAELIGHVKNHVRAVQLLCRLAEETTHSGVPLGVLG